MARIMATIWLYVKRFLKIPLTILVFGSYTLLSGRGMEVEEINEPRSLERNSGLIERELWAH